MAADVAQASNEAQIRELIDDWVTALRAKNIDGLLSNHVQDIVLFDVPPPLQYRGADVYRKNWEEWFPTLEGPVGYEIRELSVTADDDVAFSHWLTDHQHKYRRRGDRRLGARDRRLPQDQRQVDGNARARVGALLHGYRQGGL